MFFTVMPAGAGPRAAASSDDRCGINPSGDGGGVVHGTAVALGMRVARVVGPGEGLVDMDVHLPLPRRWLMPWWCGQRGAMTSVSVGPPWHHSTGWCSFTQPTGMSHPGNTRTAVAGVDGEPLGGGGEPGAAPHPQGHTLVVSDQGSGHLVAAQRVDHRLGETSAVAAERRMGGVIGVNDQGGECDRCLRGEQVDGGRGGTTRRAPGRAGWPSKEPLWTGRCRGLGGTGRRARRQRRGWRLRCRGPRHR